MSRTCEFGQLEDSLIRDRIVIGIRDEPTRRRLLQVKKLSLGDAIDACKASEATSRRLRIMGGAGEVDALEKSRRQPSSQRAAPRDASQSRRCKYCDKRHEFGKRELCPAYNVRCRISTNRPVLPPLVFSFSRVVASHSS